MSSTQRIRDAFDRMQHVFAKRPAVALATATIRARIIDGLRCEAREGWVDAAVEKASTLQVQESRLSPQLRGGDLPGTCHHLSNGGRLKWVK